MLGVALLIDDGGVQERVDFPLRRVVGCCGRPIAVDARL